MNFGILLVQGIVNSFGTAVMAAFAVAVKIDTIAYMPVQDFGNAFSGIRRAKLRRTKVRTDCFRCALCICQRCRVLCDHQQLFQSWLCAQPLMPLFVDASSAQVVRIGVQYFTD